MVIQENNIVEGRVFYVSDNSQGEERERIDYDSYTKIDAYFQPIGATLPYDSLAELERKLLERLWQFLKDADFVVSFNGKSFDLYVLRIKSMLHDLDIPLKFLNPQKDFHLDLIDFLSENKAERRYSFDFLCRKFGISTPKRFMDGSMVLENFKKGNFKTIAIYNLFDSIAVAKLYLRLKKYLSRDANKPTEAQKARFIKGLCECLCYLDKNTVEQFVEELIDQGVLTKESISPWIEFFKNRNNRNRNQISIIDIDIDF